MKAKSSQIQLIAWCVLALAFGIFVLLAIGGPLSLRLFVQQASRSETALVEAKSGTLTLADERGNRDSLSPAAGKERVSEGWEVSSQNELTRALITFEDALVARPHRLHVQPRAEYALVL